MFSVRITSQMLSFEKGKIEKNPPSPLWNSLSFRFFSMPDTSSVTYEPLLPHHKSEMQLKLPVFWLKSTLFIFSDHLNQFMPVVCMYKK